MNEQDLKAFEEWRQKLYDNHVQFRDWQGCDIIHDGKNDMLKGWQAACSFKQKEIDELERKLRESQIIYNHIVDNAAIDNLQMLKLKEQNKKLCECVEFYAKTKSWDSDGWIVSEDIYSPWGEVGTRVGGKLAKETLKDIEK